ncbi:MULTISPECIES: class I SAM-dependent DNA methyltransferase [Sinorhizobium]|uniref:Methyltransferase type 11 n=1 Tax=Sinorhizobium americanum TaxID=194963 RepID=A0A2S3YLT0_9HYPH|nr:MULTISPECIES: class I SAM-dependent methyltransferase [Sinorhizobium]PDT32719.1 methyltransferase type 11 [Sinorhizobium sp. FG01]PDT47699.1 methyltransferase type 11 [Sinorhizobium sp. NG07B]POH29811.1 methyltransferase type 11 [Sinorhizobium americanum]POH29814.1 methyltransferase type 11 [Sinorhizobium americanum]
MDTSVVQQNTLRQAAQKRIKASHALGGDADRLAQYYHEWADSYELDVERERYCGPSIVAELAGALQAAYIDRERAATAILDAGCGTGLVGVQLEHLGFRLIDGFDLSETMAEMARQTGVYRNVEGDVDLSRPISDYSCASYDMTVCCGVFTLGHVHPHALRELARVTRPNGFVVASACESHAGATSFEDEVMCLQEAGVLTPEQCLNDGKFLGEEDAHYWILRVNGKPAEQRI